MNRMGMPGQMPNGSGQNSHLRYVQGPPSGQRRPFPPQGGHLIMQQRHLKKKRYADKIISANIRELVPESDAYMDLLNYEQKLDATITRKRLEIQESLKKPMKVKRRLRIYISHTYLENPENDDNPEPKIWELRVEGRLMEEENGVNGHNASRLPKRKFSSFFKRLVIELDKELYGPECNRVEWTRSADTNETDGFQVKRPGEKDVNCVIKLWLEHSPSKFRLHPRLAKVLGMACETRQRTIEALWEYIKVHKLQDPDQKEYINLDKYLQHIFQTMRMRFSDIPHFISNLLYQMEPIELTHVIRQNSVNDDDKGTACYDIEVEVDDPLKMAMNGFMFSLQRQQHHQSELQIQEAKLMDFVEQINETKQRRDFYARITEDPVEFVNSWLESQRQDLKTITEAIYESDHERKSDCYLQGDIKEGVNRYLFAKTQQKRAELEQSLNSFIQNHNSGHPHAAHH